MKVLVIGGGGREHALAWRLAQCKSVSQVYAVPGNPGIAQVATCVSVPFDELASWAQQEGIGLTVVGPEAPLLAGIVDQFRSVGLAIVGPTQAAAQLEGSKTFAKQFMQEVSIPTARFVHVESVEEAREALPQFGFPIVLKADGLAAGKGVVIAQNRAEALEALPGLLAINGQLVIEEFLDGEEISYIGLSDGKTITPFAPSQDHKRIFDNDQGPNTGGMGAYSDDRLLTQDQEQAIMERVMQPALDGMQRRGTPFTGFLYAGMMMTADGPKVLEFNVRLGDPETQVLLHRLEEDFAEVLLAAALGDLQGKRLLFRPEPSVCVVLAAEGYPEGVNFGDSISGIDTAEQLGAVVFQAGTKQSGKVLQTAGGRVLGVTQRGEKLQSAVNAAYDSVSKIQFRGMQYRSDIASKGLHK